jgi:AraC-like DNA-binding protein
MASGEEARARFLKELGRPFIYEDLFDAIADTVFFVKDVEGRYVAVNRTLADRTRRANKSELIGLSATEVFPGVLGELIAEQDRAVLMEGRPLHGKLELHLYPGGVEGWCLTWKEPVLGRDNKIIGLSGISRDLQKLTGPTADMTGMSRIIDHVHRNIDKPLRIGDLAQRAALSAYQLDVRIRGLFGLSIRQYLVRARIELACSRLRHTGQPISRIALDCGYGDQAAFTRQFRKSVGLTPWQYQLHHRVRGSNNSGPLPMAE